ncbi:fatty acid--CoA ligase family protein [Mycobacterium sp.]|uniref:class I adenylate-forming enzyme family protein n=1 Tax=Mycobacterium sp. TaxID=1785 RepID=UPI0011F6D33F|nr:fatty acid--CoA ligase family protein [Mycobacterium sp.]TAM64471.1 MAG: AMP-dependent synthetase [Mycobacterium sp.]
MTAASVSPQTGVAAILARSAAAAPTSTALIADGVEYTFGELLEEAESLAAQLAPRTRVLVRLANNAASVVAIHAAWRAGCSVVAASTMVPESEVARRNSETSAASLITPGTDGTLGARVEHTGSGRLAPAGEAVVMFTSGTTGTPKGASLTFAALRGSLVGIASGTGLDDAGRPPRVPARGPRLVMVPIAHMGGLLGTLTAWWLGKPVLLATKFSPQLVVDLCRRYRLGMLPLTPAMAWELTQLGEDAELAGVDHAIVGTAALPEATRVAFEAKYHVPILRNYGQTEFAGAIAFERPDDVRAGRRPDGTVGRVAPGVEVAILDPDGEPLPIGEVGEIAARAPSSMSGYLDASGHPANPGAWPRTGDLGKLDDDQFVYVVGRVRDMVVCGGFNVYPAQVEAALNELPEVADSAVAGLPDERLGEVPVAAIVLTAGATGDAEAVRQQLRSRLAPYELPRQVIFVAAIPRLETGKVDRPGVARLVEGARG